MAPRTRYWLELANNPCMCGNVPDWMASNMSSGEWRNGTALRVNGTCVNVTCPAVVALPPLSGLDSNNLQHLAAAANITPAGAAANALATWANTSLPCHELDPHCLACDLSLVHTACGGSAPSAPGTPGLPRWYCNYQGVTCREGRVTGVNLTGLGITFRNVSEAFYLEKADHLSKLRRAPARARMQPARAWVGAAQQAPVACGPHACALRAARLRLCTTRAQPCAPPPLPAPVVCGLPPSPVLGGNTLMDSSLPANVSGALVNVTLNGGGAFNGTFTESWRNLAQLQSLRLSNMAITGARGACMCWWPHGAPLPAQVSGCLSDGCVHAWAHALSDTPRPHPACRNPSLQAPCPTSWQSAQRCASSALSACTLSTAPTCPSAGAAATRCRRCGWRT